MLVTLLNTTPSISAGRLIVDVVSEVVLIGSAMVVVVILEAGIIAIVLVSPLVA
jgi:hypothetical protein